MMTCPLGCRLFGHLLLQAVIALDAAVEACQPAAADVLLLDRLHIR
jgi:hypothetical protein